MIANVRIKWIYKRIYKRSVIIYIYRRHAGRNALQCLRRARGLCGVNLDLFTDHGRVISSENLEIPGLNDGSSVLTYTYGVSYKFK